MVDWFKIDVFVCILRNAKLLNTLHPIFFANKTVGKCIGIVCESSLFSFLSHVTVMGQNIV